MEDVLEIDIVFQQVRQAARRLRLASGSAITQQILLLGDAFYGYRFYAADFTAVWSAADQVLKIFDIHGRALETFTIATVAEETPNVTPFESLLMIPQRRAA